MATDNRIPLACATPQRVRELLGGALSYYAKPSATRSPASWRHWLKLAKTDPGFGEVREPDDWKLLLQAKATRVLSVDDAAVRWVDERGYDTLGGGPDTGAHEAHRQLFCRDDPGDDVRQGYVTREAGDVLHIEGTGSRTPRAHGPPEIHPPPRVGPWTGGR